MTQNEISSIVIKAAYRVHEELGPGLLETVYETALEWHLKDMGLKVARQQPIPLVFRGIKLQDGFRADLIVEGLVIIEIKSIEVLPKVPFKIMLTYLRLADLRLGLIINFSEEDLKDGIRRVVNGL